MVPVSVVIPFYNDQAYCPAALRSIRRQSEPPAEIIVVDDGSGPAAEEFLASLSSDITLLRLPKNLGPAAARNAGVRASTQPYVAFLDCDDEWSSDKLAVQHEFMRAWPELDMSNTLAEYSVSGNPSRLHRRSTLGHRIDSILTNYTMTTPSIMIKRQAFERVGGFDPRFRCSSDWDFCIRCVLADFRIATVPKSLVVVRRHDHGNHSANWRCFLVGHLRVVLKHRAMYRKRFGLRRWVHQVAFELYRGGTRAGGLIGGLLKIPYRVGF